MHRETYNTEPNNKFTENSVLRFLQAIFSDLAAPQIKKKIQNVQFKKNLSDFSMNSILYPRKMVKRKAIYRYFRYFYVVLAGFNCELN